MRPRTLAAALAAPLVLSGLAPAGRPEDHEGDEMANRKDKGYSGMRRYYTEAAWQARLAAGQACAEQREAGRCRREVVYDELIVRGRLPHTTETGNPVIARDARGWPLSRTPDEREGSPCARRTDGSGHWERMPSPDGGRLPPKASASRYVRSEAADGLRLTPRRI